MTTGESYGSRPFDIDIVMERIEHAMEPYPKAALFELAEEGFGTPFEQLLACMISIRTRDEVTLPTARRLFSRARTPSAVQSLEIETIDQLIQACSFHQRKAAQMWAIADQVLEEYGGNLPCESEVLTSFAGIGPKCANLALAIGCDQRRISVDVHVHRITNRWGYIAAGSPEATMAALETRLPERYWIDINRLLVPFGKVICRGPNPKCSACPVRSMCARIGLPD